MRSLHSYSPEFKKILATQFFTYFGEGFYMLAVLIQLERVSQSSELVSWIVTVMMLPALFVGPLLGRYLDRTSYRSVVLGGIIGRSVMISLVGAWIWVAPQSVVGLCVLILVNEIFWYLITPSMDSLIKLNLSNGEYQKGESLNVFSFQLATVISMLIAGQFTAKFGVEAGLFVGSVCYLIPSLFISRLKSSKGHVISPVESEQGFLKELRRSPALLFLLLLGAWNFPFTQVITVLLNGLNFQMLSGNETSLGELGAIYALGSLAASFFGLKKMGKVDRLKITAGYVILGALLIVLSITIHKPTAFILYFSIGLITTIQRIFVRTVVYPAIPSHQVGAFFSTMSTLGVVIAILSVLLFGKIGGEQIRLAYLCLALAPLLAIAMTLAIPSPKRAAIVEGGAHV